MEDSGQKRIPQSGWSHVEFKEQGVFQSLTISLQYKEMPACHHLCFISRKTERHQSIRSHSRLPASSKAFQSWYHPGKNISVGLILKCQHGSSSCGIHLHRQNPTQFGKHANTLARSFFMIFQVGLGDEEESGTLTKTRLVFSYGRSTADASPALSLQCWPAEPSPMSARKEGSRGAGL